MYMLQKFYILIDRVSPYELESRKKDNTKEIWAVWREKECEMERDRQRSKSRKKSVCSGIND